MGCAFCSMTLTFEENEFLPGQGPDAVEIFEQLHLTNKDVDMFYTAFVRMCTNR